MNAVMLRWGPITFEISTLAYEQFTQSDEYRWATIDRVGRRPAKQWMGLGEQTIDLSGVIFTAYDASGSGKNPVGTMQIETVRRVAKGGIPYMLTDGRGLVHGVFCLTRITEDASAHYSTGAPRKQQFTICFERYGDDDERDSPIIAGRQGDVDFRAAEALRPGYIDPSTVA